MHTSYNYHMIGKSASRGRRSCGELLSGHITRGSKQEFMNTNNPWNARGLNPHSAEILLHKQWRPKGFVQFEIVINFFYIYS